MVNRSSDYKRLLRSSVWLRLRRDTLTRHPLCEDCAARGLLAPATEVHHITPVDNGRSYTEKRRLAYDPDNLRALCHGCHVRAHLDLGSHSRERVQDRNAAALQEFKNKFLT